MPRAPKRSLDPNSSTQDGTTVKAHRLEALPLLAPTNDALKMRVAEWLPADDREVLFETDAQLREASAVNTVLRFVWNIRDRPKCDGAAFDTIEPLGDEYLEWVASYLMDTSYTPEQLVQDDGRPLHGLLLEAVGKGRTLWLPFVKPPKYHLYRWLAWLLKVKLGECNTVPIREHGGTGGSKRQAKPPAAWLRFINVSDETCLNEISKGHLECLQFHHSRKPCVMDDERVPGLSAVHLAARVGQEACLEFLCQSGAKVNRRGEYGFSPLHEAAEQGHAECVAVLVAHGALSNSEDNDRSTPLHQAAKGGHVACIKQLLPLAKVDVMARDRDGATPLHYAAEHGHDEAIRLLVAAGADVNAEARRKVTSMHLAARYGFETCVKTLHSLGAEMNRADWDHCTPLQWAIRGGYSGIVEFLEGLDAQVTTRRRYAPLL